MKNHRIDINLILTKWPLAPKSEIQILQLILFLMEFSPLIDTHYRIKMMQ